MRAIITAALVGATVCAAHGQPPPSVSQVPKQVLGDFDGDGITDWAGWLQMGPTKCALQVSLGGKPGSVYTLILADGSECDTPIDVAPPAEYATTGVGAPPGRMFQHDVILSVRRSNVRSLYYWDGQRFSGTWVPE